MLDNEYHTVKSLLDVLKKYHSKDTVNFGIIVTYYKLTFDSDKPQYTASIKDLKWNIMEFSKGISYVSEIIKLLEKSVHGHEESLIRVKVGVGIDNGLFIPVDLPEPYKHRRFMCQKIDVNQTHLKTTYLQTQEIAKIKKLLVDFMLLTDNSYKMYKQYIDLLANKHKNVEFYVVMDGGKVHYKISSLYSAYPNIINIMEYFKKRKNSPAYFATKTHPELLAINSSSPSIPIINIKGKPSVKPDGKPNIEPTVSSDVDSKPNTHSSQTLQFYSQFTDNDSIHPNINTIKLEKLPANISVESDFNQKDKVIEMKTYHVDEYVYTYEEIFKIYDINEGDIEKLFEVSKDDTSSYICRISYEMMDMFAK